MLVLNCEISLNVLNLYAFLYELVAAKGPKRDFTIVKRRKDKSSRRFTANLYTRTLSNGEKCDRN